MQQMMTRVDPKSKNFSETVNGLFEWNLNVFGHGYERANSRRRDLFHLPDLSEGIELIFGI